MPRFTMPRLTLRRLIISLLLLVVVFMLWSPSLATPTQAQAAAWQPNTPYAIGALVTYNGSTYRCIQAHTSLVTWEPPNVPALWQLQTAGPTATNTVSRPPTNTPNVPPTTGPVPTSTRTPTPAPTSSGGCPDPAYSNTAVYTKDMRVSYNGHTWVAKWWTQGETPSTGGSGVWGDLGACNVPTPTLGATRVGGFVVSEAQFNQMFPNRNNFYSYNGLVAALSAYPAFANTGSDTIKKQEAAAFLANVNHETGGLIYIVEQNTANYPYYCDNSWAQYPCAAGKQYYGRGPIQLSWNFNYGRAGEALGLPLLTNPDLVAQDSSVAWRTGIWYWMTQIGPGTMTPHNAMVNSAGFGETIRSINGSLECGGRNPQQVQSRVTAYQNFTAILGVSPGSNLTC